MCGRSVDVGMFLECSKRGRFVKAPFTIDVHATCSYRVNMQHKDMGMNYEHAVWTSSMNMQHRLAAWSYSLVIQHVKQHGPAAWRLGWPAKFRETKFREMFREIFISHFAKFSNDFREISRNKIYENFAKFHKSDLTKLYRNELWFLFSA